MEDTIGDLRIADDHANVLLIDQNGGENHLTLDSEVVFDLEFVEHDQAAHVFKSPRPSYTLDELQKEQTRQRLLMEQYDLNDIGNAVCEDDEPHQLESIPKSHKLIVPEHNAWLDQLKNFDANEDEDVDRQEVKQGKSPLDAIIFDTSQGEEDMVMVEDDYAMDEYSYVKIDDHEEEAWGEANEGSPDIQKSMALNDLRVEEQCAWAEAAQHKREQLVMSMRHDVVGSC